MTGLSAIGGGGGGGGPFASVTLARLAAQVIAKAVGTDIEWDTVIRDPAGLFNPATPAVVTVPANAAFARVQVHVGWASATVGQRIIDIRRNNWDLTPGAARDVRPAHSEADGCVNAFFAVAPGDVIAINVLQGTTASLGTNSALNNGRPTLHVEFFAS